MLDLVTGGAGFIGSHLVDRLLGEGRSVRVVDSMEVGKPRNLEQHAGNDRLDVRVGDVADPAVMAAASRWWPAVRWRHATTSRSTSPQAHSTSSGRSARRRSPGSARSRIIGRPARAPSRAP